MYTLPKSYRLFYNQIKQIINATPSHRFFRAIDLSITVWLFFRSLNHLAMFFSNFEYDFWRYDYAAAYGYYFPKDYNLILEIIIVDALLFGILSQYLLCYSSPDCMAWRLLNELVLVNVDIYLNCTTSDKITKAKRSKGNIAHSRCKLKRVSFLKKINIFAKFKRFFNKWWFLKNVNLDQMMQTNLKFLPNLNLNSRVWICLTLDVLELYYPPFVLTYSKLKLLEFKYCLTNMCLVFI